MVRLLFLSQALVIASADDVKNCTWIQDTDYYGGPGPVGENMEKEDCCADCQKTEGCVFTVWNPTKRMCWHKPSTATPFYRAGDVTCCPEGQVCPTAADLARAPSPDGFEEPPMSLPAADAKSSEVGRSTSSGTCGTYEDATDFPGNDLSHTSATTADECCNACASTEGCKAWTLWESGQTCYMKTSDAGRKSFSDHTSGVIPAKTGCSSSLDCSLNGDCVEGTCHCDAPWSGGTCETMRFKPVKPIQGYGMHPNLTTWGGGAIYDGKKYHLYVSAMTNECPLSTWTHNSRIDHATADDVAGPYEFQDVAVNTWSHNAAPVELHDGTYAIFHIGNGDGPADGGQNCTQGLSSTEEDAKFKAAAGSTIHVSDSLQGPWTPLEPNTLGGCNNPAPWAHPNGTIYIFCNGKLKRAEDIHGPWSDVTSVSTQGGPAGRYEDPVLYTDKRGFHVFFHVYNYDDREECVDATVSAHVFSEDGYTWRASPVQPYGTQIEVEGGETLTVSTRERPKLFFDKSGQMTHLFNGVCFATQCPSEKPCVDCKYTHWDYTLAQPLDLSAPTPAPYHAPTPISSASWIV